jgi:hypothetical protein
VVRGYRNIFKTQNTPGVGLELGRRAEINIIVPALGPGPILSKNEPPPPPPPKRGGAWGYRFPHFVLGGRSKKAGLDSNSSQKPPNRPLI